MSAETVDGESMPIEIEHLRELEHAVHAMIDAGMYVTAAVRAQLVLVAGTRLADREAESDPVRVPSSEGFDDALQRHRREMSRQMARMRTLGGATQGDYLAFAEAVFFLLAVAHQPVPGVVEIGGASPEHEYEYVKRDYDPKHIELLKRCENGLQDMLHNAKEGYGRVALDVVGVEKLLREIRESLAGRR